MDKSAMKSNVLQQLIEAMMGETSGKMKPKMITIDIIKPIKKGESLEDVLDEASEKNEYGREAMSEDEGDVDRDGDHDIHDHALEKEAEMYEDAKEGEMEDDEEEMCSGGPVKRGSLERFFSRK
mgnify:CR=1 FL=1